MKFLSRLYHKALASIRETSAATVHIHPDGRTARALRRQRERKARRH